MLSGANTVKSATSKKDEKRVLATQPGCNNVHCIETCHRINPPGTRPDCAFAESAQGRKLPRNHGRNNDSAATGWRCLCQPSRVRGMPQRNASFGGQAIAGFSDDQFVRSSDTLISVFHDKHWCGSELTNGKLRSARGGNEIEVQADTTKENLRGLLNDLLSPQKRG
jgi:hypothetical protein